MKKPVLALFVSVGLGIGSAVAIAQPQDQQNGQDQQQGHRRGGGAMGNPQQHVDMLAKQLKAFPTTKSRNCFRSLPTNNSR